jgi:hypothetical protein
MAINKELIFGSGVATEGIPGFFGMAYPGSWRNSLVDVAISRLRTGVFPVINTS